MLAPKGAPLGRLHAFMTPRMKLFFEVFSHFQRMLAKAPPMDTDDDPAEFETIVMCCQFWKIVIVKLRFLNSVYSPPPALVIGVVARNFRPKHIILAPFRAIFGSGKLHFGQETPDILLQH